MKPRVGLSLSGGGSKGAFTVGVLRVLDTMLDGVTYPVISGTSTGALIATLLTTKELEKLKQIYTSVTTKNIVNPHHALVAAIAGPDAVLFASAILGGRAIYDASALKEMIRANINWDRVKRRADKTLMIYNTVDLRSGKLKTFNNRDHSSRVLAKALLGSSNMPVLTDPVPLELAGEKYVLVDGGIREFLPLRAVFNSGIDLDHIVAISTAPRGPRRQAKEFSKILDILKRTVDLLGSEVAKDDYTGALLFNALLRILENAQALQVPKNKLMHGVPAEVKRDLKDKRPVPVTWIGPDRHIDMNSLVFEPAAMRTLMNKGMRVAKREGAKLVDELS